jgi:transposase-like protein
MTYNPGVLKISLLLGATTCFADAIKSIFPDTTVQTCIVHQLRNSIKYVANKNQKEFMRDLKLVYRAVSKEQPKSNSITLNPNGAKTIQS